MPVAGNSIYHERWREIRNEMKYQRMIAFAHTLPAIRAHCQKDLPAADSAEKVLAAIVRLLETTLVRVGNDEYAGRTGLSA